MLQSQQAFKMNFFTGGVFVTKLVHGKFVVFA